MGAGQTHRRCTSRTHATRREPQPPRSHREASDRRTIHTQRQRHPSGHPHRTRNRIHLLQSGRIRHRMVMDGMPHRRHEHHIQRPYTPGNPRTATRVPQRTENPQRAHPAPTRCTISRHRRRRLRDGRIRHRHRNLARILQRTRPTQRQERAKRRAVLCRNRRRLLGE